MTETVAAQTRQSAAVSWLRFVARRLAGVAAVLMVLVVLTFGMIQLIPGDPARAVAGQDASPAQIAEIRRQLGLDQSLFARFGDYVSGLLHGNLGTSFQTGEQVSQIVADRLVFTVELALPAVLIVLLVAVPLGMVVAIATHNGRRRPLDNGFTVATSVAGAIPEYIVGTALVLVFAVLLGLLPAAGAASGAALILPVLAVALGPSCTLARIVRRETTAVLGTDYSRTARGRRLPPLRRYARHALPNLLTSTLTIGGLLLAHLLGGTVVVETVFAWPGLGSKVVEAIAQRDYPVIQGIVLVLGAIAAVLNLFVDVALGFLDPRTLTGKAQS
ncbi:ABC transporter permease [Rhodococcus erythropolis]|uniref:ABC transporter permease n=1 Tax=Rhodococcus erythropolis TaxID=1833 RepID=UPI002949EBDD|nr:ABC transporter permease [Rhodococcus erythropolis]MDV6277779.1 ABC transporter permease [Rhodococcus erythropolis]